MAEKMLPCSQGHRLIVPDFTMACNPVVRADAVAAVPDGFRIPSPSDIALVWKYSIGFRNYLYSAKEAVWLESEGVCSFSQCEIDDVWGIKRVTNAHYWGLPESRRVMFCNAGAPVVAYAHRFMPGLFISGIPRKKALPMYIRRE